MNNVVRKIVYSIGAGMVIAGICHAFGAGDFVMYLISWGVALIIGAAPDRKDSEKK